MCAERSIRAAILVDGLVQGVGYRAFARKAAEQRGLVGGVKNLPDGRVEVVAEGPREQLDRFMVFLKQGPSLSRVSDLSVQWSEATGEFDGFRIWY